MRRLIRFFRHKQNWPIVLIPLLLMGWAKFGAPALGLASFDSATLYAGPYREPLPPGPESQPVVERVVVVVVDGLRLDVSREMPFLNLLRQRGADRLVRAGQPSLSLPGWTAIGTGAWQETSGITSNYVERAIDIDTIFAAAQRAGLTTGIAGSPDWEQLYGANLNRFAGVPSPDEAYTNAEVAIAADRAVLQAAEEILAEPPDLTLVHFAGVDSAGHGFGGASPEYRQVAMAVDSRIEALLAAIDLERGAVFVTADHGHTDPGGHSGPEPVVLDVPLVAVGAGVRPGSYSPAHQVDLAPTLATLLGTSMPAHNLGQALLDQVEAPAASLAVRAIDNAVQLANRYDSMLAVIGSRATVDRSALGASRDAYNAGDFGQAIALSQGAAAQSLSAWESARAARLNGERLDRAGIALVLLAPVGLYLVWWRRARWNAWAPALGAAVYALLWNANYHLVQRLTYSSSWFNQDADILPFLTARVIEAMIALLVVTVLIGVMRRQAGAGEVARDSLHTLLAVALALMLQILAFYVLWGVVFEWYLPDFRLGFKYYLDVFQTTVFWPLTPLPVAAILPLLALATAWLARRVEAVLGRRRPRPAAA